MVLSIVQMKDMLSIQQQELLRRQLLYMYEFWECTWDEAMLPICLWLEGLFPTVHITRRTFFPNSTWDEVWPPNCLWLSIIGRTFFLFFQQYMRWGWGYLYSCVSLMRMFIQLCLLTILPTIRYSVANSDITHSLTQWQGHLLSCSGQLKTKMLNYEEEQRF